MSRQRVQCCALPISGWNGPFGLQSHTENHAHLGAQCTRSTWTHPLHAHTIGAYKRFGGVQLGCGRPQVPKWDAAGVGRKQLKDAESAAKFDALALCDFNLQTFSGSTSDSRAIEQMLGDEAAAAKALLEAHLVYASLLCRISLDDVAIEADLQYLLLADLYKERHVEAAQL